MSSPQWKNFQPPSQPSTTPSYQRSPSFSKTANNQDNSNMSSSTCSSSSSGLREAGIVEKLLHSYGFIQCSERQARLFFHFSQFSGKIEHLKIGDSVEYEMTYDRRTGKPIASSVTKISSEALSHEVLSDYRVSGFVTTEISDGSEGRVAYENRGECFFLPYTKDDLEYSNQHLKAKDKVAFHIATDKKSGNLRARKVRLEKAQPVRYQGVVCALKETFGFIERADVVKEIFFHSSECKEFRNLDLGADVEFSIQTRNNKEVAVNVTCLPSGTVVFEDIDSEETIGRVIDPIDRCQGRQQNDPLSGKIQYHFGGSDVDLPFGDKDPLGDFTLQRGDWVRFKVATDRRDNLQRATNIEILDESFLVSGEQREQGIISNLKESFGFIKCANRDSCVYFRFSELLNPDNPVQVQDEVEFTVTKDPVSSGRSHAIRIKQLPSGTVCLNSLEGNSGTGQSIGIVEKTPSNQWSSKSPSKGDSVPSCTNGIISFYKNGEKEIIHYQLKDCDSQNQPRSGDKVEFTINTSKVNNQKIANDVKVVSRQVKNGFRYAHRGFIAALKDSFGFIETEDHKSEVFFHFSVFDGNPSHLELGQEVGYGVTHKGGKQSAECVRKLAPGSIPAEEIYPEILNGTVYRTLRCFNPEQEEYSGLIALNNADEDGDINVGQPTLYPFGITSLYDKHDMLQKGDVVQFQIGIAKATEQEQAMNIKAVRTRHQSIVEAIRGSFGFLAHEVDGKKLFFHMSEVRDGMTLQTGDKVDFVVVHNQRTGRSSACNVVKTCDSLPSQRPERLISRLRIISDEGIGPRVIVVRQPKGPDGTTGFKTFHQTAQDQSTVATSKSLELSISKINSPPKIINTVVEIMPNVINGLNCNGTTELGDIGMTAVNILT
ncbi:cold shock domain-containing protein E1-like [Limulus polyphemus]|uniref:Cold shock domain-containing protein E1-like n=1 Tax=Limulus polyphemus TaxID=6850 RepID=A0ABM1B6P1_LIMPO|nr:cold shock domain-containing protein E1-like [Limulus polyphemus]